MRRMMLVATLMCATTLLAGCGSVLYLPSDAVYEDVEVTTNEDLRDQITVSADYCDDVTVQGTLTNNSTSDATVGLLFSLDDGVSPQDVPATVEVGAGATVPFTIDNSTGVNPIMGCYATVTETVIVP